MFVHTSYNPTMHHIVRFSCFQSPNLKVVTAGRKPLRKAIHIHRNPVPAMATDIDYICCSPLLANCGFSREEVEGNKSEWQEVGDLIKDHLKIDTENMSHSEHSRVYQYYLPVAMWVHSQLKQHRSKEPLAPLVVGITAPQGCGKTTIVECLYEVLKGKGVNSVSVSIDDFYLTRENQQAVTDAHSGNKLLSGRGNAGTFDVELGTKTLESLRGLVDGETNVKIPRYDKSAFKGLGDRADDATWPIATGPLDVVLLEGWMLGFKSIAPQDVKQVSPDLVPINENLKLLESAWDRFVDIWLVVKVGSPDNVFQWRLEAEQKMRQSGKPGMTDDEVRVFCDRFMPAYGAYLPGLYTSGPTTVKPGKSLMIELDKTRSPTLKQPRPLGAVDGGVLGGRYELLFLWLLIVLI